MAIMIALPFIFFSIWAWRSYKKNGLCIGTYILLIYTVSSLCSIFLDAFDLYADHSCPKTNLGIFAPLIYIAIHTICIYPFYKIGGININLDLNRRAERRLRILIFFYFIVFLIVLFVSSTRVVDIFINESLKDVRNTQYTGETESFYNHIHGPFRYVCAVAAILSTSSLFLLPVFGFLLVCNRKSVFFSLLSLISSLTPLLISINIADRSQFMIWILLLGATIAIFWKNFEAKQKFSLVIILGVILSGLVLYLVLVTISRFEERDGGAIGGVIQYIGMPYINCCRFFNELNVPNSVQLFFPSINNYITHGDRYFDIAHKVETITHQPICVLPSFIGIIYSVCGFFGGALFLCLYVSITNRISRISRYKMISISYFIKFWAMAVIQVIGPITYFYISEDVSLFVWLFISFLLKDKISSYESVNNRTTA